MICVYKQEELQILWLWQKSVSRGALNDLLDVYIIGKIIDIKIDGRFIEKLSISKKWLIAHP